MAEDKLIVGLSADIKDLKAKLTEAQGVLKGYANDSEKLGDKSSSGFDKITTSIKGLIGAFVGLQAAQVALSTAFTNSLKMDALQGSFSAIFGSAEAGERQLERLRAKSEELGVEFSSLADSYKLFAGATTQSGMSIAETNKIFDSVAKASAVLKLSADDTQGALRALAQMMSKGKVSAEELNGQLGERIPGAFKLAANAIGVTEQELIKMLSQGEIMSRDLLPKLATELDKAFGNKVKGNIGGLTAEWNRFKNAIFGSTSGFSTFFATILGGINTFLEKLKEMGAYMADPKQFQADKALGNLKNAIDKASNIEELNKLIIKFKQIQSGLEKGTPMWRAYTDGIIEAGNRIKDFEAVKIVPEVETPKVRPFQEDMQFAEGTGEQLKTAKELFDLYQKFPQVLSSLGAEYARNPFFRDLINEDLNKNLKALKGDIDNLQISSNMLFTDPAMEAYIANMQNVVNMIGGALTQSFESALTSGQNFFKILGQALKALVARLLAAVAAAAVLSAILNPASLAAAGGFKGILGSLTGFNLGSIGAMGGAGQRLATPGGLAVNSQGGTFNLRVQGNELVGVLNNTSATNNRIR